MHKFFPIYEEAVSNTVYVFAPDPNFHIYSMRKIYFLFYQCSLFLIGSIQGLLTTHFPFYNHFYCYTSSQLSNSLLLINSVLHVQ